MPEPNVIPTWKLFANVTDATRDHAEARAKAKRLSDIAAQAQSEADDAWSKVEDLRGAYTRALDDYRKGVERDTLGDKSG